MQKEKYCRVAGRMIATTWIISAKLEI